MGTHGALSVFQPGDFDPQSCPILPSDWWQAAKHEGSFWLIFLGSINACAIPCLCVSLCCFACTWRQSAHGKQQMLESNRGRDDTVVGRPCGAQEGASTEIAVEGPMEKEEK